MKTPLYVFFETVHALENRPFYFLAEKIKITILLETQSACARLKKILEKQNLKDTHAYRVLEMIELSVSKQEINEVAFIQSLGNLIEVYQHGEPDKKTKQFLRELHSAMLTAKKSILEYHILLEALEKKGATMSGEQKKNADLKHVQNVGVFYVLEYTLQVLYEFSSIADIDKKKLLAEGLKTKAGNLPAYIPLEETFRKDLCLKLYDTELRERLLLAFYNFEDVLYGGSIPRIRLALKIFNLELLEAFQDKGLTTFKALLYKPFGNNIPIHDVIKEVERLS